MPRRFTALRVIGTVLKVLAWIFLLIGLFGAILALITALSLENQFGAMLNLGGPLAGISAFVVIGIVALFQFLFLYALGDSVYVFLAIEENTRRAAYFAQQQYVASQPVYPVTPPPSDYED